MASAQERLKLKRPCEVWSVKEQLCLASSVLKSGDQNWMSVSRSLKPLLEKESQRPVDWFSQKSCALQYAQLLENADTPKRKKRETSDTIGESIVRRLTQERIAELSQFLSTQRDEYQQLKNELNLLKSGNMPDDKLQKMWLNIEQEEREQEQKSKTHTTWLVKRQKQEGQTPQTLGFNIQRKSDNSEGHDTLDPNTDEEEKKNKGGRSPLLTSLLKSPSPTTQIQSQTSSAQVTSPTIASLLGSSPKIPNPQLTQSVTPQLHQLVSTAIINATPERPSAGAPTLSMLLELPANLQRATLPNLQPHTSNTANLPQQNVDLQLMQIDNQRSNIQIIEPPLASENMSTSEMIDHIDEVIPKDIMADVIDKDEINEIIGDIEELIKGEIPDNPQVLDPGTAGTIENLNLPQQSHVSQGQEIKNQGSMNDSPESEIALEEIDSSTSNIAEIIGTVAVEPKLVPQETKSGDEKKSEDNTNLNEESKNEKSLESKDSDLMKNSEVNETESVESEKPMEIEEAKQPKDDAKVPDEDPKKSVNEEVKKIKEDSKIGNEVSKSTKEEANKSTKEELKAKEESTKEIKKNIKEEAKKSTKEEVKKVPKEEIKKTPKEEVKKNSKEEVKKNTKEEMKKNLKEEVKKNPKEEIKKNPKEEVKKNSKEEVKKNPKEEVKKNPKEEVKKNSKEEVKKNPKEEVKKNPKEEVKKNPKEEVKKNPKEDVKKILKEEVKKVPKEEVKKNPKEDVKKVSKEDVKRNQKEPKEDVKRNQKEPKEDVKRNQKEPKEDVKRNQKETKEEMKKNTKEEIKKNSKEEAKKNLKEEVKKNPNSKEDIKKNSKEEIKKVTKEEVKKPNKEEIKKCVTDETRKPTETKKVTETKKHETNKSNETKKSNEEIKADSNEQKKEVKESVKNTSEISKDGKESPKIDTNEENENKTSELPSTEKQNSTDAKSDKDLPKDKKSDADTLEVNLAKITGDQNTASEVLSISSDTLSNEDTEKSQDISLILEEEEALPGNEEKKKENEIPVDSTGGNKKAIASSQKEISSIKIEIEDDLEEMHEKNSKLLNEIDDIKLENFKREDTKDSSDGTSNTELLETDMKDFDEDEDDEELQKPSVDDNEDTLKESDKFRDDLLKKDVTVDLKEENETLEEMSTDVRIKSEKGLKEEIDDKKNVHLDESVRKEQTHFSESVSELDEEESSLSKLSGGRVMKTYSKKQTIAIDSEPEMDSSEGADYRAWKKAVMLVYNRLATHKYASAFLRPITEDQAPGYHSIIFRPMDLSTIKKNIDNGTIRSTRQFQRDVMLMFQNAIMYNKHDTFVYKMAITMQEECLQHMQILVQVTGEVSFRRETRTAASTSNEASDSGSKRKRSHITPSPHDTESSRGKKRRKSEND